MRRPLLGAVALLSLAVAAKASEFKPVFALSSLNRSNGFRLDGAAADDNSAFSVSAAGDVNGDGFADVIVGAFGAHPNGSTSGSSYVVFGRMSGLAATLNLSTLNGNNGFRLDGAATSDFSGRSVSGAGDVNGDGFADAIARASKADPNGSKSGSSYVVFGRAPDSTRTRTGSAAGQYISGGKFADTLSGLGGKDELEGREGSDVLKGGLQSDTARYAHAAAWVVADLAQPASNTGAAAGDSYAAIENLRGSAFADTLNGDAGANIITGGGGSDALKGRAGNDRFRFLKVSDSGKAAKRDKITDLNPGTATSSVDQIDLSAIDAKPNLGGNQAFVYRGIQPFSGTAGEIRVRLEGSNVIVEGNVSNDTASDFEIQLDGLSSLTNFDESDFIR